jgi:hypothetical protein
VKWRWSRVASFYSCRRSPIATTAASTKPELQVPIADQKLTNPLVVGPDQIDDRDRSSLDIDEEFGEGLGAEPLAREPVELDYRPAR